MFWKRNKSNKIYNLFCNMPEDLSTYSNICNFLIKFNELKTISNSETTTIAYVKRLSKDKRVKLTNLMVNRMLIYNKTLATNMDIVNTIVNDDKISKDIKNEVCNYITTNLDQILNAMNEILNIMTGILTTLTENK